jgi:DNA primase
LEQAYKFTLAQNDRGFNQSFCRMAAFPVHGGRGCFGFAQKGGCRMTENTRVLDRFKYHVEDYILSHEPNNVKRIGRALYLKDHDSFEISNGLWNWHSRGIGGKNVIDYLIKVRGYGFVDAVRHLAGEELTYTRTVTPKARLPTDKRLSADKSPFRLPRRCDNNERVIEYLQSRGIDETLIQECIRQNILYESADFHNVIPI